MSPSRRNNVQITGNPDGPPMVFAHGFGCDQGMWRRVAPAFEATHRVVLFDHVGAGGSDASGFSPARYASLSAYARDIVEFCIELDLTDIVFVGHSVSAMIGVLGLPTWPRSAFASLRPDRPVTPVHRRRGLRRRVRPRGHRRAALGT